MTLKVAREEFPQIRDDWDALLHSSCRATVFQTQLWHHVWWQELGGHAELYLTSLREDGALVGLAPLMYRKDVLTFFGDTDLWDYHDILVARGKEANFYPALFDFLLQQPWTKIDLLSLRQDSSALTYLPDLAKAHGYTVEVSEEDVSPGVALPSTWDGYLEGLSRKNRHELLRKLRRLEKESQYRYYAVESVSALEGALQDFFLLMRDSRQDKAMFLTHEREQFFRYMAEELASANLLRLFFLEISGQRVASAMCFDYGETRFLYNSGYNPGYSSLSVGLLLKALCLRHAIEEGKGYFDFLRGNERYKYDLGAKDVNLYRLVIQR